MNLHEALVAKENSHNIINMWGFGGAFCIKFHYLAQ
jgi:hypothetical protein